MAEEAIRAERPAAANATLISVPVSSPSADAYPERRPSLMLRVAT